MKPVAAGAPVVAVHFLGDRAAFVLGEEALLFVAPDGASSASPSMPAAFWRRVATARASSPAAMTARSSRPTRRAKSETLATDAKHRWIDRVALGPDGAVAWSAGKQAFVRTAKGEMKSLDLPSSVGGLAFAPKGLRLAVAHYGGVTLWFPNAQAAPEMLAWKGSHLDVVFSPDGRFLVTGDAGADAARLAPGRRQGHAHVGLFGQGALDGVDARAASGSRPRAPSSSSSGRSQPRTARWASSRAWSRPTSKRAVAVACHPKQEIVAVGFEDGLVMLCRIEDGAEILAKKPGAAPVSALAWSADGSKLAFGTEDGEAGIVDLA